VRPFHLTPADRAALARGLHVASTTAAADTSRAFSGLPNHSAECSEPDSPASPGVLRRWAGERRRQRCGLSVCRTVEVLRDVADKRSDRRKLLKNVRGGTIIQLLEGAPPRSPREDARGIP
jgi:hypothetical protein